MDAQLEKMNSLFEKYKDKTEGMFHNCLWQLMVNEVRDLKSGKSCFVYIRYGDHQVGIVDRGTKGYVPATFRFKSEVSQEECIQILRELNQEIFMLTPDQTLIIEFSSY